jgi:hypothetical protein
VYVSQRPALLLCKPPNLRLVLKITITSYAVQDVGPDLSLCSAGFRIPLIALSSPVLLYDGLWAHSCTFGKRISALE